MKFRQPKDMRKIKTKTKSRTKTRETTDRGGGGESRGGIEGGGVRHGMRWDETRKIYQQHERRYKDTLFRRRERNALQWSKIGDSQ